MQALFSKGNFITNVGQNGQQTHLIKHPVTRFSITQIYIKGISAVVGIKQSQTPGSRVSGNPFFIHHLFFKIKGNIQPVVVSGSCIVSVAK
jgi:hypothetical protein